MGNGLDMRSLEHCLSDLMRGCGDGAGNCHTKLYFRFYSNVNFTYELS